MKTAAFLLAAFISLAAYAQPIQQTTIVSGLAYPVAFDVLPNGDFILTLKGSNSYPTTPGTARIVLYSSSGTLIGTFYDLSDSVNSDFERGLLGICVDPNYSTNNYVYAYYNHRYNNDERIRVVRFTNVGNVGTNPTLIFDLDVAENIAGNHVGGNIRINPNDPDKLFISIGDLAYQQGNPALNYAPRLDLPYGKILRIKTDGTIPTDNPFYDDGNPFTGNCDWIWSYGHRNPFDFAFSDVNDSLYSSENGWNAWDECNMIHKGRHYGWANCEGFFLNSSTTTACTLSTAVAPLEDWATPLPAVTGILHYSSNVFFSLTNHLLVADNDYGRVYDIVLGNAPFYDQFVSRTQWADLTTSGGLTTLKQGSDGCVYAMKGGYTTAGTIYRVCPQGMYVGDALQQDYFLQQIFPNPASGTATLNFQLRKNAEVSILIADITGKVVAELTNGQKAAGEYSLALDLNSMNLADGTYFCTLYVNGPGGEQFSQTVRMAVIR
ncbi:MAG: PQQ-dependent sugar dehydrogenase [Bacteroidota bacterium]